MKSIAPNSAEENKSAGHRHLYTMVPARTPGMPKTGFMSGFVLCSSITIVRSEPSRGPRKLKIQV